LSSELINQVVVVARIAVDGAAHCQSLTVCKTLSSGQAQFGHEVEIGGQFAAGVADRTDFVVLASRRTVGDKYLRIVNASGDKATELEAGGRLSEKRTLGGLPVMYVPNMPANTLLITPLANLSIYYQVSGERRHIKDVPEKDQIECYQSKNIDFIVEEYGAAALVEYGAALPADAEKMDD